MDRRDDSSGSRNVTDQTLRVERTRADDEVLERSTALGENAEDVIRMARERARSVLAIARMREDRALGDAHVLDDLRAKILDERQDADDLLAGEYADADAEILDELSARRRAIIQLLALERGATDRDLARERRSADQRVSDREDLLGSVSHDLRNHLSALLVSASVLILSYPDDPKLVGLVRGMQTAMAQMDNLVGSFLDLASLDAGKLRIEPTPTDLTTVVAEEVDIHRAIADSRSLTLTLDTKVSALPVEIDARAMSRVLLNILANAIKFTPANGSINVRVDRDGNDAAISITDNGPGIAADRLESIFERFSREDPQRRGYGLGLYIARAIINAHGGRIWAESTLGKGTTFQIRLPALT